MKQKNYLKCRGTRHRAQKERGITLIALVITIILLLILAGVTLKIVLDNNFVDKTQLAVDRYSEAQKNETEQIKYFLENYLGEVDNTEGNEHRTLNGEKAAYNNPIIPVGFKTSSEGASWTSIDGKTVQGWNDGLVIEDKDGNQFVWVPVDGTKVKYEKWNGSITHFETSKTADDTLPNGIDENDQITKYGGFYIGRYEAGIPQNMTEAINTASADKRNVTGKPVSKKNQVPWNFIDYNNAKTNSESMYTYEKVKSGLITGTMWDTVMLWLKNANINVETDCKDWGNYRNARVTGITEYSQYRDDNAVGANWRSVNSIIKQTSGTNDEDYNWLLKTGNTEYTKRKNIYDLAGNLWELTNEIYSPTSDIMYRGGCYSIETEKRPAMYRMCSGAETTSDIKGFRVVLYVI